MKKGTKIIFTICLLLCCLTCKKTNAELDYNLIVAMSGGVSGSPESGTYPCNQGDIIYYNYSVQSGYENLTVTLDGISVVASGSFSMNSDHRLDASASKQMLALNVSKGLGIDGSPNSGSYSYNYSDTVSYNYFLQSGYDNLIIKLDGNQVAANGNITMNANHQLTAEATNIVPKLTLTVDNVIPSVSGFPRNGTYYYNMGDTVYFDYSYNNWKFWVLIYVNGVFVSGPGSGNIGPPFKCSGSFVMTGNTQLFLFDV